MRRHALILIIVTGLLIFFSSVHAQSTFASSADSVRVDTLASGIDTFTLAPDSLYHPKPTSAWLLPMSVIAATGAAILLLFTTRSR